MYLCYDCVCNVYACVYVNVGVEDIHICVFPPWTPWLSQPWEYSRNEQPAEYSLYWLLLFQLWLSLYTQPLHSYLRSIFPFFPTKTGFSFSYRGRVCGFLFLNRQALFLLRTGVSFLALQGILLLSIIKTEVFFHRKGISITEKNLSPA